MTQTHTESPRASMSFFKRLTKPKARLSLSLDKGQFFFGDDVKGVVNLSSQEEFIIEKIVVSLKSVETIKRIRHKRDIQTGHYETEEYWDSAVLYSDKVSLAYSKPVASGLNMAFPFVFRLPVTGRETYRSVKENVVWKTSAFVNVKGRKRIDAEEEEILVANTKVALCQS